MNFLKQIVKDSGNKFASIVDDGIEGADVDGFIDTGSYAFNALLSGSLHGGIANNKIVALAGESATGKTYFTLGIVSEFLKSNKDAIVLYFDTEQAVTSEMFTTRGVDPSRVAVFPVATIEEFKTQCVGIVDKILEMDEAERKPMMIVLDSLGMLSTEKEMNDSAEGKNVRDMTRAQGVKATFRVLTMKLGKAKIPLIMTNHVYAVIGCLSDDVDVLMEDGSVKNISDVVVGDKVETMGGSSLVTELFSYDVNEVVEVELSDGTSFFATPNHKFMTRDGSWKPISDIGEGEEILAVEEFSKS
jgi:RecA/RadA recombinase